MEIINNKGKIKINELKLQALINILRKEGVIQGPDIEEELNSLIDNPDKED